MIYIRIWGGLGNQLFQYAYARALQLRCSEAVRLCLVPEQGKGTVRQYGLDKLNIRLMRDRKFERAVLLFEKHGGMKKLAAAVFGRLRPGSFVEEKSVRYDEKLKHIKGNCYVSGFLQNENYFKDYEKVIRKEISLCRKLRLPEELGRILDTKNTVSVHIRRTDYKRYGNLLDKGYYERALKLMDTRVKDAFYVVFSDDLKWVQENMQFGKNVYFVNGNRAMEDYEELFAMSKCKNHIIANSTFSWWGAWLNADEDKIVVGPKRWFRDNSLNIMPDAWLKV